MRICLVGVQIQNSADVGQRRPLVFAGVLFATVPIIVFNSISQLRFIQGVTMSDTGGG